MEFVDEIAEEGPVRFETSDEGVAAWSGGLCVAKVRVAPDGWRFAVSVRDGRCTRELAAQLLSVVDGQAPGTALLGAVNPVVRDAARRAGYEGELRAPLVGAAGRQPRPAIASGEMLAEALSSLTALALTAQRAPARMGRLLSAAHSGFSDVASLAVADPFLQLSVPLAGDLMVEDVAIALDTLVAVRRWFGEDATHLTRLSFDRARNGRQRARWAGQANLNVFAIHINADFVLADGYQVMSRHRRRRPGARSSATVDGQFIPLDGTVAHEAWHQIEAGFATRRLADRTELRRQLGLVLGVETLEHAIIGGHRNAPEPWRAAHQLLAQLVSPYATTNPIEATAEMFKLWWCRISNPVVDRFGELLQGFFGVAAR